MLELSRITSLSRLHVCFSGFRADAAVTCRPIGAGRQRSPPGLHSCLCCLGHRAGHPAHHTHSLPVGTYRKTAGGTYRAILKRVGNNHRLPTRASIFSKENTVWMNTSCTCSCQPCSLWSLLCLPWCCRTHPSPAELNSTATYQQSKVGDTIVTALGRFLKFVWPCRSVSAVTRFPRPASPLQDVATIIGSREMLSALLLLYDHQLEHEGTTGWESLLWVVNQL